MAKVRDKDSRSFKETTANMTGKEKIAYIWEYFKWPILGSIAGIVLLFSMVHAFVTNRDAYLSISFISGFEHTINMFGDLDGEADDATLDESSEETPFFSEVASPIWVDFELISTLEALFLSEEQRNNYNITIQQLTLSFETVPVFTTHAVAGVIDMMGTYIIDLHPMIEAGYFKNMTALGWDIPAHMMYNDYAIYLRYLPIFDDYVAGVDEIVLGISAATRNIENVQRFFEFFLD